MAELQFHYRAVDATGHWRRGSVISADEGAAFAQLRRDGLSPISLREARQARRPQPKRLRDRESADFVSSLADLLDAGADIRTALGILSARFERATVKATCRELATDISGGDSLERSFERAFPGRQTFVATLVAAGEAAGDLSGGLRRASEIMYARLKLRDQLVSVLSYPGFVFLSAIAAVFVILLFIVPSIAPLAAEASGEPPRTLSILIAASTFLSGNLVLLLGGLAAASIALVFGLRSGVFAVPVERLLLDGPARRTVAGIVFGAFALSLGSMLAAGAPISDALRLAIRSAPYAAARRRLGPVLDAVREGQALSDALENVPGFPRAIVRLAAVGEASNRVGQLLIRGGRLEEDAALRRLETVGRVAGPALIVGLGALLGVLMGGLLSGVSQMGQSALG